MAKKKKELPKTEEEFEKYQRNFIIAALRRSSLWWPYRNQALVAARAGRGVYRCATCSQLYPKKEVRLDHISPVVRTTGFTTWGDYFKRMLPKSDGWQVLCLTCNHAKTQEENIIRKLHRDVKKKKKQL